MIMLSKFEKRVVIGIGVLFIFIVLVAIVDQDLDAEYGAVYPNQRSQPHYPTYDNRAIQANRYNNPQSNSSTNRSEVLKTKVKGYRESTYWGSEHPIDERIKEMNDDEFSRYISEKVAQNDNDVYWGAEY